MHGQNNIKATDNRCNEKRQSYGGKYKPAPDGKAVPAPNYALAAASGAAPPRIISALDHCQRSPSRPMKRFLRRAANRKLEEGDTASYPWRGSHHKCSVIGSFAKHNTDWLFRVNNSHSWHSADRAPWYILIIKANKTHYFSNLIKYSTCFGHVHCPSSGVSQYCIQAVGICHARSVGWLPAVNWSSMTKYLPRVYNVETLLTMDSGPVRNM
jgi:hypothetical protein